MKNLLLPVLVLGLIGCGSGSESEDSAIELQSVNEMTASNDSSATAQSIPANSKISGNLGNNADEADYYLVTASEGKYVTIKLSGEASSDFDIVLYDQNGNILDESYNDDSNEEINYVVESGVTQLVILVEVYDGSGDYTLTVTVSDAPQSNPGNISGDAQVCTDSSDNSNLEVSEGTIGNCNGSYAAMCRTTMYSSGGTQTFWINQYYTSAFVQAYGGHDAVRTGCLSSEVSNEDGEIRAQYTIL